MNLIIKINLDNAAFEKDSDQALDEVLGQVQDKLETVKTFAQQMFILRDSNSNTVGSVEVTP